MKKLRRNTNAKALAIFLLAFFVPLSAAMTFGAGMLRSYDAYEADTLAESRILDELYDFDINVLPDYLFYNQDNPSLEFRMKYAMEKDGQPQCNTVVKVTDEFGETALQNYEAEIIPSTVRKYTLSYVVNGLLSEPAFLFANGHDNMATSLPCEWDSSYQIDNEMFRQWLFEEKGINTEGMEEWEYVEKYSDAYMEEYIEYEYGEQYFTVPNGYFNITLAIAKDAVRPLSLEHLAITGYENRWGVLGVAALSAVVSLVLTVYLAFAAGWRGENDRPMPTVVERIPLGVFLGACAAGVYLLCRLIGSFADAEGTKIFTGVLFCLAIYAMSLLVVSAGHSLVTRFKCKGWMKNTLIYRLYMLFDWVGRNLSDLGAALLCGGVWLLVNLVLLAVTLDRLGLGLILMALFNLVVALAAVAIIAQWQRLKKAASAIAGGDFSRRVDTEKMFRHLREHGESINRMGEGVSAAVDEQMKSERMKTDLITNVSHDLKTPLTSIVSYVGLLKNEHIENETARGYIETLDRQATRLGRLIEDLVEASRATSGSIKAEIMPVNVGELLEQAVGEYEMRLEQSGITPVLQAAEPRLIAMADGRLLWRVFDNLLSNACKYGLAGTRLYIDASRHDKEIRVVFRNVSADRLNIPAEELMERFVRGDSSRTTSGSGLGLTIARSLTEIQNGVFSLEIEGDMFKAFVSLPVCEMSGQPGEE